MKGRSVSARHPIMPGAIAATRIAAPIVGATKESQLEDAVAAVDIQLDEAEIETLEAPYQPHGVKGMGPSQPRRWRR